jgi:hypothetical protein
MLSAGVTRLPAAICAFAPVKQHVAIANIRNIRFTVYLAFLENLIALILVAVVMFVNDDDRNVGKWSISAEEPTISSINSRAIFREAAALG